MRQTGGSKINRAPTSVLLAAAADIVQQTTERSKVFNEAVEDKVPRFEKEGTKRARLGVRDYDSVLEIRVLNITSVLLFVWYRGCDWKGRRTWRIRGCQ